MEDLKSWIKFLASINYPVYVWQLLTQVFTGRMVIAEIIPGLYQSSKFNPKDFSTLKRLKITAIIDLQGEVDALPKFVTPEDYLYWPIHDAAYLPPLDELDRVTEWGVLKLGKWKRLLVHCTAGHNRSGLVNGVLLVKMGWTGKRASERIRSRMPGALANPVFREYVENL